MGLSLHSLTSGFKSVTKSLISAATFGLGSKLTGTPLGTFVPFITPNSLEGKAAAAAGAAILGAGVLGSGSATQNSTPQANVGSPYGNAGYVYPGTLPYLPALGFGSDVGGYTGGYGSSNDGTQAPPVTLSPAVLAMAALGFLVLILLIFRR